jgi:hypothetical protein
VDRDKDDWQDIADDHAIGLALSLLALLAVACAIWAWPVG